MIWLYFRTAAPLSTIAVATLCPAGMWPLAVTFSPGIAVPGRMSVRATTTLSAGLRRMARVGMARDLRVRGALAVGYSTSGAAATQIGRPRDYGEHLSEPLALRSYDSVTSICECRRTRWRELADRDE